MQWVVGEIQDKLKNLTIEEIKNIGNKLFLFKEESFLKNETIKVNEDVFITVSSHVPKELQQEVVRAISNVFEEE